MVIRGDVLRQTTVSYLTWLFGMLTFSQMMSLGLGA